MISRDRSLNGMVCAAAKVVLEGCRSRTRGEVCGGRGLLRYALGGAVLAGGASLLLGPRGGHVLAPALSAAWALAVPT